MIKVYPMKPSALNVVHPIDGRLEVEGSFWTYDGFTCRCLTDGAITDDEAKAYKPAPAEKPSEKPAEASAAQAPVSGVGEPARSRIAS